MRGGVVNRERRPNLPIDDGVVSNYSMYMYVCMYVCELNNMYVHILKK